MDNTNSLPPQPPPSLSPTAGSTYMLCPLGDEPADRDPIPNFAIAIECMLRQPRRVLFHLRQPGSARLIGRMLTVGMACSLIYGIVVGSFSGGVQWWAAPIKVTVGFLISALICLPSLYIFACLSGSRARLSEMIGLVSGLFMLMTILLIGFAPVAWLFSQSTNSIAWMGFLHLLFGFIAALFGLRFMQAGFSHSQARSKAGFAVWVIIFMLVTIQMTTALRPIIGKADTFIPGQKLFFISHWGQCMK
jgi:hypothetical protein